MIFGNRPDTSFYTLLEAQAQAANEAAQTFYALTGDFGHLAEHLGRMESIEHQADMLTHSVISRINGQFLTPLDKEDMHILTARLDDITDAIESAASRMGLYRLARPRPDLESLVCLLVAITQETKALVSMLHQGFRRERLSSVLAGIHALESRGDRAFRQALSDLFDDQTLDSRLLIQWKDVYERIENAINQCEKLAGFVEGLTAKYA